MKREEDIYIQILCAVSSRESVKSSEQIINTTDVIYEKAIKRLREISKPTQNKSVRFVKPTVDEVRSYIKEKSYQGIDAEKFINFYDSKGWKVGKTPMKNWKAAVANWASSTEKRLTTFSLV